MNSPIWMSEGREPSPKEWVDWFYDLSYDEKLLKAESIIRNAREASACFVLDHEGRIVELERTIARRRSNLSVPFELLPEEKPNDR